MTPDPSHDPTIRTGEDSAAEVFEHPERIGPYKILQVIGEGGMGVVYEAEQTAPVRRRVALKMMKVGMDTKEVVARFEAERQGPPQHRQGAGRWRVGQGTALFCDGTSEGSSTHRILRHEQALYQGSA